MTRLRYCLDVLSASPIQLIGRIPSQTSSTLLLMDLRSPKKDLCQSLSDVGLVRFDSLLKTQTWYMLHSIIRDLYPNSAEWIDRKLVQAENGDGVEIWLATQGSHTVGASVTSSKGRTSQKLSTIWVDPLARSRGVGRMLALNVVNSWYHAGIEDGHVTVADHAREGVERLLTPFGFHYGGVEKDRYGEGRNEHVLLWNHNRAEEVLAGTELPWAS